MKLNLPLLTVLLLAPLVAPHAADAPPSPVKTGVILVNHVGFPPNAAKHCVIPAPPKKEFTVHQLKDTKWTQVYAGELIEGGNELEPGWVGDFSAVKDDGIYQVRCGSLKSRAFPGAVSLGLQYRSFDPNQYGNCGANEYDMPGVCNVLWPMAEQAKQQGK